VEIDDISPTIPPSKRGFRNVIHILVKPADARESADIHHLQCDRRTLGIGVGHSYFRHKIGHARAKI